MKICNELLFDLKNKIFDVTVVNIENKHLLLI